MVVSCNGLEWELYGLSRKMQLTRTIEENAKYVHEKLYLVRT
uniref:Uncharacterized protein n=1 Tax=Anguilla anguilla TaxID=7936 RepID=A0A0E9RAR3_ANGAN